MRIDLTQAEIDRLDRILHDKEEMYGRLSHTQTHPFRNELYKELQREIRVIREKLHQAG